VFDREHAEDIPGTGPPGGLGFQRPPRGAADAQNAGEPPKPQNIVVDRAFVTALGLGTPEEAVDKLVYRPPPPAALAGAPPPQPPMRIIGVVEDRSFSFFKAPTETAGAMYALQADLGHKGARAGAARTDQ